MTTMTIDRSEQTVEVRPEQMMYDFLKLIIDGLYDALVELVSDLPDISISETIYLRLPSNLAFKIAFKYEGTWTIPDFRLPAKTVTSSTWMLSIPGLRFTYIVNWPIIKLIDLIFPKLANFPITSSDLLWYHNGNYVMGSTFNKLYTFADLMVDGTATAAVVLLVYGLTSFGAHRIQEAMTRKTFSTGTFKPSVSIKSVSDEISIVKNSVTTVKSVVDTVKTNVDTANSGIAENQADISSIKNLSAGTSIASNITSIISKSDDAAEALNDLGLDTTNIISGISTLAQASEINVIKNDVALIKSKVKYGPYS